MAETEFLSLLVDETLKLHKTEVTELTHLETKLKDYQLQFIRGEFIPQTQMLRFQTSFGVLDVPSNWSLFMNDDYSVVSSHQDEELFLSVLKNTWNPKFDKLLITHSDGFSYVIGLKSGEEAHLRDLVEQPILLKSA